MLRRIQLHPPLPTSTLGAMTDNINELLSSLPIDRIAGRLGEDPAKVEHAAHQILPALLAGMGANAQDPAGRDSLAQALNQHDPSLVEGGVDVDAIDTEDGAKIAHHIFGPQEDQVAQQLGGLGAGSGLVKQLLPILAPLAMSWLAGRLQQRGGQNAPSAPSAPASQGGLLEQILGQVLGGSQPSSTGSTGSGGIFGDLLGGLLGGGRR